MSAALPVGVMVVWVAVLLWQITQLGETARWVDHTDQVLAAISRVEADTAQRVADVRAFLVTRSPDVLAGLAGANPTDKFAALAALTADNAPQVERTKAAGTAYGEW